MTSNGRNQKINVEKGKQGFQTRERGEPAVDRLDNSSTVGACPDCGAAMGGRITDHVMLPGSQCAACGHEVATFVVFADPLYDEEGETIEYTLDADATIRARDEDGNTIMVWHSDVVDEWEDNLSVFELGGHADSIRAALRARDEDE